MRFIRFHFLFSLMICFFSGQAQKPFSWERLFACYHESFDSIVRNKQEYRLQLIYTQIDRDASGKPHFTTYSYDADKYYYYCASMIKLPASLLALEKLNNLKSTGITMFDSLVIDTNYCDNLTTEDMTLRSQAPCIAQYIKEMMLISSNRAFNPVYDFLGQAYFHNRLREIGYMNTVVCNRFSGCDTLENRRTNPVSFYQHGKLKHRENGAFNNVQNKVENLDARVGRAHLGNGMLYNKPKDFSNMNYLPLTALHDMVMGVAMGNEGSSAFNNLQLSADDYAFMRSCMTMFPHESLYPQLDSINFPDHYMKYFISLDSGNYTMPEHLRVLNKVGQAYGFMTDCSYVIDTLHDIEFVLSCSMYLNKDGIINDGRYEYDETGYPFFHNIFNAVYLYELTRPRTFKPALQFFPIDNYMPFQIQLRPVLHVKPTQSLADAEKVLCALADIMRQQKNEPATDIPTAEQTFFDNTFAVWQRENSFHYPFHLLQKKGIRLTASSDGKLRVLDWQNNSLEKNYGLLHYLPENTHVPIVSGTHQVNGVKFLLPKMVYQKIYTLADNGQTYYLLYGLNDEKDEILRAVLWNGERFERPEIFSRNGIVSNLLKHDRQAYGNMSYDEKLREISIPYRIKQKRKWIEKTTTLKWDGTVFK